jgi:hypothetical protein
MNKAVREASRTVHCLLQQFARHKAQADRLQGEQQLLGYEDYVTKNEEVGETSVRCLRRKLEQEQEENFGVDWRIILKWILKKQCGPVRSVLDCC